MSENFPQIIGLCGDIGSGKDAVADYLVEHYGYRRLSWAEPLKVVCLRVYGPLGAEPRHFFGSQADKNEELPGITDPSGTPQTGRKIMEHIGTDGFRFLDRATWVKHGIATQVDAFRDCKWVVSDVRFTNEFEAIHSRDGVVWQTIKLGAESTRTGHTSDEEWRKLPKDALVVAPPGRLTFLYQAVDELIFAGGKAHKELLSGD
jgi:hypothetical protein